MSPLYFPQHKARARRRHRQANAIAEYAGNESISWVKSDAFMVVPS